MDNKDNDLNLVDEMDDVGKLEKRIGTSELKIKINNFLFQYVSSNTTVGELEKMAVEIYDKILSTYNE